MRQTNEELLNESRKILDELKVKRGGTLLPFHKMMANDPGIIKGFSSMYDVCATDMKHIPRKYRELIVFAVGCAMNAPTTIEVHSELALKHGATMEELGEALRMVFFLCGVSGLTSGLQVLEEIDYED